MVENVTAAIAGLEIQFAGSEITVSEDGNGGAHVIIEPIDLGDGYKPQKTWIGAHLSAQLPYADVYPIFIGGDVARASSPNLVPPVTAGHTFQERPALQISMRSNAAQQRCQTPAQKLLSILHWLKEHA